MKCTAIVGIDADADHLRPKTITCVKEVGFQATPIAHSRLFRCRLSACYRRYVATHGKSGHWHMICSKSQDPDSSNLSNMLTTSTSQEIKATRINTGRSRNRVVWQSRYEGCVAVAYVNGRAIAGISGPWSDKYALTCWERPTPAGQLELFESLDAAKHAVEHRVQLAGTSRLKTLIDAMRRNSAMVARALLPHGKYRLRLRHQSPQDTVMQLRLWRQREEDTDLSGMYFHAFE